MKKMFSKRLISIYLGIAILISTLSFSFAWFFGTIDKTGISIQTGQIQVEANGYKYESGTLTKVTSNLNESIAVSAANLSTSTDTVDTYFIVERNAGSIDVDYSITLLLENTAGEIFSEEITVDEYAYIGGYWFRFSDITDTTYAQDDSGFSGLTGLTNNEKQLMAYIVNYQYAGSTPQDNTGTSQPLSMISSSFVRGTLEGDNNANYYRLTYGYSYPQAQYTSTTIKIRASIYVAQKGALTDAERESRVHTVSNPTDFLRVFQTYLPGDTIKVVGNITYQGDLVFSRPCNLVVVNSTLQIYGNLIYSFPYVDDYYIDTASNGLIIVSRLGAGGGFFEIDTPNSRVHLIGKGNQIGSPDMYVQNLVTVDASYNQGLVISGLNIYNTNSSGGVPVTRERKIIFFDNNTRIEVAEDTRIYSIQPTLSTSATNNCSIVHIVNYGTIDEIILTDMVLNTSITEMPQIYIDNYGTYGTSSSNIITLPSWSSKYIYDTTTHTYTSGNTRIVQQMSSNELDVLCPTSPNTAPFLKEDIEVISNDNYVRDVYGDNTTIEIYYMDELNGDQNTLQSILFEHYNYNPNLSDAEKLRMLREEELIDYNSLKIYSYRGKELTSDDYSIINDCTNLAKLDLSNALTESGNIPANCFKDMTNLSYLSLPSAAVSVGANFIEHTLIDEITFPRHITYFDPDCLEGSSVLFVHIQNTADVYSFNDNPFIFVEETMIASYRAEYADDSVIFPEATKDYYDTKFYRLVDGSSSYEIVLQYGSIANDVATNADTFTIDKIWTSSTKSVSVSSVWDYAFYRSDFTGKNIVFGNDVTNVGAYSFYQANAISVTFNKGETIGNNAFEGATIPTVNLGMVKTIADKAFYNTTISIFTANSVETVGISGFENSTIPSTTFASLKTIAATSFKNCDQMIWFKAPNLTYAGNDALSYMGLVELIYLPKLYKCDSVAISNNNRLTEVYLGTLYEITSNVLDGNNNISFIYLCGTETYLPTTTRTSFYNETINSQYFTVIVSEDLYNKLSGNALKNNSYCFLTGTINPKDLKHADEFKYDSDYTLYIGDYLVYEESNNEITAVYYTHPLINNTNGSTFTTINVFAEDNNKPVTKIFDKAFYRTQINNVNLTIGANTVEIGAGAFDATSKAKSINAIDASHVKTLKKCAFKGVSCVTGDFSSVTSVDEYSFSLTATTSLNVSSLVNFSSYSFTGADLEAFTYTSAKTIDDYAFFNAKLPGINFSNVTALGISAFEKASIGGAIDFATLESMGDRAFYETSLSATSLSFPELVTAGNSCFENATANAGVTSFSAPELTTAGTYFIRNYTALEYVYTPKLYHDSTLDLANVVFDKLQKVHELYVGAPNTINSKFYSNCTHIRNLFICGTTIDAGGLITEGYTSHFGEITTNVFVNSTIYSFYKENVLKSGAGTIYPTVSNPTLLGRVGTQKYDNTCALDIPNYFIDITGSSTATLVCSDIPTINSTFTDLTNETITANNSSVSVLTYNIPSTYNVIEAGVPVIYTINKIGQYAYKRTTFSGVGIKIADTCTEIATGAFTSKTVLSFIANGIDTLDTGVFTSSSLGYFEMNGLVTAPNEAFKGVKFDSISMTKVTTASGAMFQDATFNCDLVYFPNLQTVGWGFFYNTKGTVKKLSAPALKTIGTYFCQNNTSIESIYIPSLENYAGNDDTNWGIIYNNPKLVEIYIGPISTGKHVLISNCVKLRDVYMCGLTASIVSIPRYSVAVRTVDGLVPASVRIFINRDLYSYYSSSELLAGITSKCHLCDCDAKDIVKLGNYYLDSSYSTNLGQYLIERFPSENKSRILYCRTAKFDSSSSEVSGGVYTLPVYDSTVSTDPNRMIITGISNKAFRDTTFSGIGITLPITYKDIGTYAFQNKTLTSFTANGVTSLESYILSGSTVNTLTMNSLSSVSQYALANATFTNLNLNALTFIDKYAFNATTIDNYSFNSLTTVDTYGFYGTTFDDFAMDNITTIGTYAFANAKFNTFSMTELTAIPYAGFANATFNQTTLEFPSVLTASDYAFQELKGSVVTFKAPVLTTIAQHFIEKSPNLEVIYTPSLNTYVATSYNTGSFNQNSKVVELYIGAIISGTNGPIINASPSLNNIFVCGTSASPVKAYGGGSLYYNSGEGSHQIFVNSDVYNTYNTSTFKYIFYYQLVHGYKNYILCDYDAKDLVKYGTNIVKSTNIGEYLFERIPQTTSSNLLYCRKTTIDSNTNGVVNNILTLPVSDATTNGNTVVGILHRSFKDTTFVNVGVVLPNTYTSIGNSSFANKQFTSFVANGVTSLGNSTFASTMFTSSFSMTGLVTIGNSAFSGATFGTSPSFINLTMNSLTTTGTNAFENAKMGNVTMNSLVNLGTSTFSNALMGDVSLSSLITVTDNSFNNASVGSASLSSVISANSSSFASSSFVSLQLNGMVSIPASGFTNMNIGTLTMNSVSSIGTNAFKGSTIESLSMTSLQTAGTRSFSEASFTSLSIPSLTSADTYAFYSSTFGSLYLPNLQTAGECCFNKAIFNFYSLRFENLGMVGDYCFGNIAGTVKKFIAPNLVTTSRKFISECYSIESIYVPSLYYDSNMSSMTSIENVTNLVEVYLGPCTTSGISRTVIDGSPNLRSIYICGLSGTFAGKINLSSSSSVKVFINVDKYDDIPSYRITDLSAYDIILCDCDAKDLYRYGTYTSGTSTYNLGEYIIEPTTNGKGKILYCRDTTITSTGTFNVGGTISCQDYYGTSSNITIEGICDDAFKSTTFTGVNTIEFDENITSIGANAFPNINNTTIFVKNRNAVIPSTGAFGTGNTLHVDSVMYTQYVVAAPWNGIAASDIDASNSYVDGTVTYYYNILADNTIEIGYISGSASGILTIPSIIDSKNVSTIYSGAFANVTGITSIVLPNNLYSFDIDQSYMPSTIESYSIDSSNSTYSTLDGVLYSKDKSILIAYPKAKTDTSFTIDITNYPQTMVIAEEAFKGNTNLTNITFENVVFISNKAFADMSNGLTITFTNSTPSYFIGSNIFDNVSTYTIDVPDANISLYQANVLVDATIISHIQ